MSHLALCLGCEVLECNDKSVYVVHIMLFVQSCNVCELLQGRGSELQQVQAKASSNEGILRDSRADLNLKKDEMDDLRHQLKQGLSRVYGQVGMHPCRASCSILCRIHTTCGCTHLS